MGKKDHTVPVKEKKKMLPVFPANMILLQIDFHLCFLRLITSFCQFQFFCFSWIFIDENAAVRHPKYFVNLNLSLLMNVKDISAKCRPSKITN